MLKQARNLVRAIVPWNRPYELIEIMVGIGLNAKKKGYGQFLRSGLSAIGHSDRVMGLPVHITIEPISFCNLECPVCETGAGIIKRQQGTMSMDLYTRVITEVGKYANIIFLYWMGEPFLNKNIYKMADIAKDRGIWVDTCTNGEVVKPVSLALSGFSRVSFQFGGMSPATHAEYRVKGDWGRALHNLCRTHDIAKKHDVSQVGAGLIVMKHNEHEIERFIDFMDGYGVKQVELISPCVRTLEQAEKFLPEDRKYWLYDEKELKAGRLVPKVRPKNSCPWIYFSTVIAWDGTVYPCCRDADGEFPMGNIKEESLDVIWNGSRYRDFRRRISRDQKNVSICRLCSGFGVPLLH